MSETRYLALSTPLSLSPFYLQDLASLSVEDLRNSGIPLRTPELRERGPILGRKWREGLQLGDSGNRGATGDEITKREM